MSKPKPFVVPEGVVFLVQDDGVVIENAGDIVLHTNFGRPLKSIVSHEGSVEIHAPVTGGVVRAHGAIALHGDAAVDLLASGGDVSVHGAASAARVQAGGSVTVTGNATAQQVDAGGSVTVGGDAAVKRIGAGGGVAVSGSTTVDHLATGGDVHLRGAVTAGTVVGGTIRLDGGAITAKGLQGSRAVHVGAAKLAVDAIIAPEVHVDPKTAGRVTVVESQNELGPNAIKGGFRLADYAEMFGDPQAFLRDRGLVGLGETPAAPPPAPAVEAAPSNVVTLPPPVVAAEEEEAAPVATVAVEEEPVETEQAEEEEEEDASLAAAVIHVGMGTHAGVAVAVAPIEEPEPVEPEPVDAAEEDAGEVMATAPSAPSEESPQLPPEHPLHGQLVEAVARIIECYGQNELPPAVSHLHELIETRTYDKVRGEITSIWSDLLKYHQKKGMRIQHQVTTTFNTINSLVKKM